METQLQWKPGRETHQGKARPLVEARVPLRTRNMGFVSPTAAPRPLPFRRDWTPVTDPWPKKELPPPPNQAPRYSTLSLPIFRPPHGQSGHSARPEQRLNGSSSAAGVVAPIPSRYATGNAPSWSHGKVKSRWAQGRRGHHLVPSKSYICPTAPRPHPGWVKGALDLPSFLCLYYQFCSCGLAALCRCLSLVDVCPHYTLSYVVHLN